MKALPGGQIQARQLVFDAMAEDPTRQKGPNSIKEAIAHKTSLHLPRFVMLFMFCNIANLLFH